jgi:hypothetical protein
MDRLRLPILVVVVGILGYIWKRNEHSGAWMGHEHQNNGNGNCAYRDDEREESARLEELLREDVRRYEQDLRELADA